MKARLLLQFISREAQPEHNACVDTSYWTYISDIERNKVNPDIDVLLRIARGAAVTADFGSRGRGRYAGPVKLAIRRAPLESTTSAIGTILRPSSTGRGRPCGVEPEDEYQDLGVSTKN